MRGLEVGLHAVLVAGVGVHDVIVADLAAQVVLERLDRVDHVEAVAVLVGRGGNRGLGGVIVGGGVHVIVGGGVHVVGAVDTHGGVQPPRPPSPLPTRPLGHGVGQHLGRVVGRCVGVVGPLVGHGKPLPCW